MVGILMRALVGFEKRLIKMHWYFDFIALAFNSLCAIIFLIALFENESHTRNFANILLTVCFITQIPLQIWAISVIRSCYDFFLLINVFIGMAES